jgi:hypothetical protein
MNKCICGNPKIKYIVFTTNALLEFSTKTNSEQFDYIFKVANTGKNIGDDNVFFLCDKCAKTKSISEYEAINEL